MVRAVIDLPLSQQHLGTQRMLRLFRYGEPGARPKAYVQAGLHANELPGPLVAHHLIARLDEAERAGGVLGEIVVVPVANPIGLDQFVGGELLGRHSLDRGENFNRGFADPTDAVARRLEGQLGDDEAANVAVIRSALLAAIDEQRADTALQGLRLALLRLAIDADFVLDLHCDTEAIMHLYTAEELWPDAADLAAQLGCRAVLLANESGGDPFDEACSTVWWKLRARFDGRYPIPAACLSATVELRGRPDVNDAMAASDADNLFRFLQRRGLLDGHPGPLPPARFTATPLAAAARLVAPVPGVIAFRRAPGDLVRVGEIVADIVDPTASDPGSARVPVASPTGGLLWMRSLARVAAAGEVIASITGTELRAGRPTSLLVH